jgi:hypothetical protein
MTIAVMLAGAMLDGQPDDSSMDLSSDQQGEVDGTGVVRIAMNGLLIISETTFACTASRQGSV